MKKCLTILAIGLFTLPTYGQRTQEVVTAELSFAQHAVDHSVRKAFIQYADSQGVVFGGGKVRKALRMFTAMPESPISLLWHPAFSAMAKSGELGFTTGPYISQAHAPLPDTSITAGHYSTIWHKNKAGQWKFLLDIGINYPTSLYKQQELYQASNERLVPSSHAVLGQVMDTNALAPEMVFIRKFQSEGLSVYRQVIMPETWFNIEGQQPVTHVEDIEKDLSRIPGTLRFKPIAGGMSESRDFAYVYGTVTNEGKQEFYLRVWVHTSLGWKLLLQTLRS